jgi:hypothetical protein
VTNVARKNRVILSGDARSCASEGPAIGFVFEFLLSFLAAGGDLFLLLLLLPIKSLGVLNAEVSLNAVAPFTGIAVRAPAGISERRANDKIR